MICQAMLVLAWLAKDYKICNQERLSRELFLLPLIEFTSPSSRLLAPITLQSVSRTGNISGQDVLTISSVQPRLCATQ